MLFRKLGLPGLDRWIVARLMNLGYEDTELVGNTTATSTSSRSAVASWPTAITRSSCAGGGYLMTGKAP